MKYSPWLSCSATWLLLLLQRTPAVRVAVNAAESAAPSRIVALLQSAFAASVSLGAIHSLAGATILVANQPSPARATVGTPVQIAMTVTGAQTPPASWTITGSIPPGLSFSGRTSGTINVSTLLLTGTPTTAGTYEITLRAWEKINATGDRSSLFPYTVIVAGATATSAPVITTQPVAQHVTPGATVSLNVAASGNGVSYQWKKDGTVIVGATNATLSIAGANAASMGFYSVTATNALGNSNSSIAIVTVNTGGRSRLTNVSTRGFVSPGTALTPGFVLQGTGSKPLVIRAVGPTLDAFGVTGALADPMLDVIPLGSSTAIASNDNWGGSAEFTRAFSTVGAFPMAAAASKDSTVVGSLAATGATGYTVRITSNSTAASGIVLAEVYDEDVLTAPVRLVNVSTIGFVGTGDQALVPGFYISGDAPKQLLIRAVGPGLAQFGVTGVLADPQLSVVPLGGSTAIAASDNWGGTATLQAAFGQAGAFMLPADSGDAAVMVRLPPGGYTVVVSGVANATGTALVEVYDLDP